jgi:hypothetical protein
MFLQALGSENDEQYVLRRTSAIGIRRPQWRQNARLLRTLERDRKAPPVGIVYPPVLATDI